MVKSKKKNKKIKLGHLFTAKSLPDGKEHLEGGVYIGDSPEGFMEIISPVLVDGHWSWTTFFKYVQELQTEGHRVLMGNSNLWSKVMQDKKIVQRAKIPLDTVSGNRHWMGTLHGNANRPMVFFPSGWQNNYLQSINEYAHPRAFFLEDPETLRK